jgi:hypothetical protein
MTWWCGEAREVLDVVAWPAMTQEINKIAVASESKRFIETSRLNPSSLR